MKMSVQGKQKLSHKSSSLHCFADLCWHDVENHPTKIVRDVTSLREVGIHNSNKSPMYLSLGYLCHFVTSLCFLPVGLGAQRVKVDSFWALLSQLVATEVVGDYDGEDGSLHDGRNRDNLSISHRDLVSIQI